MLLAAGALAGTAPLAFPWWNQVPSTGNPSGTGGSSGGVTALSLIANLQGDETKSANVQMFEATSPVATYWQVGLLTVFDESKGQWVPGPEETEALDGDGVSTPPAPQLPSNPDTFIATVTIQNYTGRLLPSPPLAILPTVNSPIQAIRIADGIGVAVTSPITTGKSYQIVADASMVPALNDPIFTTRHIRGASGRRIGVPDPAGRHPRRGETDRAAGGRRSADSCREGAGARRLLPLRQLLLHPDTARRAKGSEPSFVFPHTDRLGFCQQFAGAFGVMARELGIPVRLAVGFTPGHTVEKGSQEYQVTGSDAHVWPEVYMGPELGWISVDPTPSPANGEKTAAGVVNYRPLGGSKGKTGPSSDTTLPRKTQDQGPPAREPEPDDRDHGYARSPVRTASCRVDSRRGGPRGDRYRRPVAVQAP